MYVHLPMFINVPKLNVHLIKQLSLFSIHIDSFNHLNFLKSESWVGTENILKVSTKALCAWNNMRASNNSRLSFG